MWPGVADSAHKDMAARRGDILLYRQIEALLREQIRDGELRPGDRIPTEAELCLIYRMSRATVRQALDALVRDGLIDRTAGRGTFVREGRGTTERPRRQVAWRDLIAEADTYPATLLRQGSAPPPSPIACALGLGAADETPFVILVLTPLAPARHAVKHHLHPRLAPLLREPHDPAAGFVASLARGAGAAPSIGAAWCGSMLAEPRFSVMLEVPLGAPLLSLWWTTLMDGVPSVCSQMLLPGAEVSLCLDGGAATGADAGW